MKIISSLILLNTLLAWKADLELRVAAQGIKKVVEYEMFVKSDAGGAVTLSCQPKAKELACTGGKGISDQGGYWVENLNCNDKCCKATIVTKNPQKSYNIEVCTDCKNFDPKNPPTGAWVTKNKCEGTKNFSLYTDGSMKYI
ncbi:hypothetical protein CONCODRAFT_13288 [Conidiobolus coronatus NRRL 28638]|uniref:Uncharacterized protein n=1 Tax=Conidiobolus coronatus (strain ATCC 28846 / CBS 209.66 / NRRL 28638) TaxID=796925 RepID=A0A137NR44_CONC2|nr:hypothetical protein CONCODRAFT_13288 [Conidiobolus coronatus NRRL 28638]|eukprot:KXN65211.1 hypothetical protein CONCODRAFT_13288 [Conidiobolus coronatus NRRL 28638]